MLKIVVTILATLSFLPLFTLASSFMESEHQCHDIQSHELFDGGSAANRSAPHPTVTGVEAYHADCCAEACRLACLCNLNFSKIVVKLYEADDIDPSAILVAAMWSLYGRPMDEFLVELLRPPIHVA